MHGKPLLIGSFVNFINSMKIRKIALRAKTPKYFKM